MNKNVKSLFEPIQIGNVTIKNRLCIGAMEPTGIIDGLLTCKFKDNLRDFYIERAKDGVGLIIPGMVPVRNMFCNDTIINHPEEFDKLRDLMDEIHKYGTKLFMQIGTFSGRNFVMSQKMISVLERKIPGVNLKENLISADEGAPNVWMPEFKCRALETKEVEDFVEAYAKLALLCKNANVDGVEIHAVHEGYLMDQFTTKYTNHRTDKYGGILENRYRFAVEVVRRIKELCGEDFPVAMRYSVTSKTIDFNVGAVPGEKFIEAGRDMEESEKAIKILEEAGVDMFDADNGSYDAWYWAHPPVYMPLNCNLGDVEHIKKFTTKPVYCAGRMQVIDGAKAVEEGRIDGVTIARQFLADHEFITKVKEDHMEDIRPCISCHAGCLPAATYKGVGCEAEPGLHDDDRGCAICSRTFCEKKYTPVVSENPKKIAVIGGGIGGMQFAMEAAKRGHSVDLYEKSDKLGGAFISACSLSFKEKDKELLEWYKAQLHKSDVNVHMNTEIKDLSALNADKIVVATGAIPRTLSIPGAEKAIGAIDFLLNQELAKETVAVIGGGLTGCEIAYELTLQGKKPFIVEMQDDIVKVLGVCAANSNMLRDLIRYYKIPVYFESTLKEIKDNSIIISTPEGDKEITCETVITSIGYAANNPFDKEAANVHVIGDAKKVGNLKTAIWAADDLALEI